MSGWARRLLWVIPILLAIGIASWRVYDHQASGSQAADPLRIVSFSVAPELARPGSSVTLEWAVDGAEEVRLDPLPGETVPLADRLTVPAPAASTDFVLTASAGRQTLRRTVRLDVTSEPPAILYFEGQPNAIEAGEGTLLAWGVAGDDVEVTLFPGEGARLAAEGSIARFPVVSTAYTLVASNAAGQAVAVAAVTVDGVPVAEPPAVTTFAAASGVCEADEAVIEGSALRLEWAVAGAEFVAIDGVAGGLAATGCLSVAAPLATQTYALLAIGPGGAALEEATVEIPGSATQPTQEPPSEPPPVVMVPVLGSSGRAAELPDGVDSGHLLDAFSLPAEDAVSAAAPSVDLFAVSTTEARLGEEIVVQWAVAGADTVVVQVDPPPPGLPALETVSGIYRFVASQDAIVRLEAARAGGAMIQREVAVTVLQPAGQQVSLDIPSERPVLLATGGATGATALATEAGDIWLFQAGPWSWVGRVATPPTALAVAGGAVFVVDSEGGLSVVDLADPAAGLRAEIDPWRQGLPLVDLSATCRRVAGVAGLQAAGAERGEAAGTLLVACANPPAVLALPVAGATLGVPTWSQLLAGQPAAIAVGGPDGAAVAVRYAPDGPHGHRVDLLDADTGDLTTLTLAGRVGLALPSRDGRVLVAALLGEPALFVLDAAGTVTRRVGLEAEVAGLSWVSPTQPGAPPPAADRSIAAPVGGADAAPPAPTPSSGDPLVAAAMVPGSVLVHWAGQPGGALVNLAVWADAPVAARIFPDRSLAGLVDSGTALVIAANESGQGVAIPWQVATAAVP